MTNIAPKQVLAHTAGLGEIIVDLKRIVPTSRKQMVRLLQYLLSDSLRRIIDTHNTGSIIFVFKTLEGEYLLKAEYGENNATAKEVDWYGAVGGTYEFPTPICHAAFKKGLSAFLLLEYIEGVHTIDDLVENNEIGIEELREYLNLSLSSNEAMFKRSLPVLASGSKVEIFFLKKYEKRRQEAFDYPYLKKLLSTKSLNVNGATVYSPDYYMAKIQGDDALRTYLTPERLGLIHGDLHFGNILVKDSQLYFVDPNGALRMPLEYDYGKILHSIHGGYGSIMRGSYQLDERLEGSYDFDLRTPAIYFKTLEYLKKDMTDQQFLRGMYAEAMHFATLLPHHAKHQKETTALFIRSVQIFEELFYYLDRK